MHKKLNDFHKKCAGLENVTPPTKENKDLNAKVLDDVEDLFNELYYI